jgi:hypothetical protein
MIGVRCGVQGKQTPRRLGMFGVDPEHRPSFVAGARDDGAGAPGTVRLLAIPNRDQQVDLANEKCRQGVIVLGSAGVVADVDPRQQRQLGHRGGARQQALEFGIGFACRRIHKKVARIFRTRHW